MRDLTKEEKNWIKRLKRCLTEMSESINLYNSNIDLEFQIYDTDTKEVFWETIEHGYEQGDPLNEKYTLGEDD